jgi:signal transduction histidine kinase/PAS domain-containing protein
VDRDRSRTDAHAATAGGPPAPAVLVIAGAEDAAGLSGALAANGAFAVTVAAEPGAAAEPLRHARFDAVVLVPSGAVREDEEAVRRVRELAPGAALVVAGAEDDLRVPPSEAGVDGWTGHGASADAVARYVGGAVERRRLRDALDASDARFHAIVQRTADGIVIVGTDGRVRFVNPAAERLFGRGAAELAGEEFGFAALAGETTEIDLVRRGGGEPLVAELRAGDTTWEGEAAQVITLRDITDRRRADERAQRLVLEQTARAHAERVEARSRFLAEAAAALDSSLDPSATLLSLARLIVPSMADGCAVDLLEGGRIRRVACVHAEPGKQALLEELGRSFPPQPDSEQAPARVLRTGRSELHGGVHGEAVRALWGGAPEARRLARLGIRSTMIVPLRARDETLGAITFVCGERDFDPDDLALAEEVASRAGRALENAHLYEAALAASRAKSDFLAVMSHELRTPLNAIMGYTQLLLDGVGAGMDQARSGWLGRIQVCALHLLQIIDEILAYAQIEAGHAQARAGRLGVGELAGQILATAEPLAREKGLELRVEVPDAGAELFTDAGKVRQIALNLLANAVKFTERGTVGLRAELCGDELVIAVSDTGRGMSAEDLERIYEPFWQAEKALTRSAGGTGLGLTISRRLAEMLGGTISAESRPGAGTTFTVRVPARMAAE